MKLRFYYKDGRREDREIEGDGLPHRVEIAEPEEPSIGRLMNYSVIEMVDGMPALRVPPLRTRMFLLKGSFSAGIIFYEEE